MTAAELVRQTKARIGDTQGNLAELVRERGSLALAVARGDADALARSAEIRGQMATAQALLEDLTASIGDLQGFARLEQAALDAEADRQRRQRARQVAAAHVRAAAAVDEAAAALALAMRTADQTAALAQATAAPIVGQATSLQTTVSCGDAVIGALVRLGAMPIAALPSVFTGELAYVRPLVDQARRHLALVEQHVPAEVVEAAA